MVLFRKVWSTIDRYIVVLALLSITCGIAGQYMMSWDQLWAPNIEDQYLGAYADPEGKIIAPLEPLARGLKVVGGVDSYVYHENEFHSALQEWGYHIFEVGRWLGFIVYYRALVWLLHASFTTLDSERKARSAIRRGKEVIAIHGDSVYAQAFARNLMASGYFVSVTSEKTLSALGENNPGKPASMSVALQAPVQFLVFESDQEALEFLDDNGEAMADDAHIYVRLDDLVPSGMFDDHMVPFSIAMICASLYWANYPVFLTHVSKAQVPSDPVDIAHTLSKAQVAQPRYRVVIIGDNDFTEQILEVGLLANISDITGGIRYDVIGELRSWRSMHPGLDAAVALNSDELHFHTGAWYDHRELILEADRVILCGRGADNVRIAAELQSEPLRKLHVRANSKSSLIVLGEREAKSAGPTEVEVFGTLDQVCSPALLMQDGTNDRGKVREILNGLGMARCNGCETFDFSGIADAPVGDDGDEELCQQIRGERISRIQGADKLGLGHCLSCPRFLAAWQRRDGLSRQNGYADTYHFCQKYRLLHLMGVPVGTTSSAAEKSSRFESLPVEAKGALREIEHNRWCRFYLLNGWTYAPGPKDTRARTHPDLVPYAKLGDDAKRLKSDVGYLNVLLSESSEAMQGWMDAVWLGNESEEETPGAVADSLTLDASSAKD